MQRNQILLTVTLLAIVLLCFGIQFASASDAAEIAYEKGKALAEKKLWKESLTYLNEAIMAKPKYALALKERFLVQNALGHHLLALQDIARAGEIDPKLQPEWHLSGRAAPWMNQQGVDASLVALKKDPDDTSALQSLASGYLSVAIYLKQRNASEKTDVLNQCQLAVDASSRGLELLKRKHITEPYTILPFYNLRAYGLTELDRTREAISDYSAAVDLMPRKSLRDYANVVFLYADRAKLYEKQNENDKALADYTTIIDMHPPEELDREKYYVARAELWRKRSEERKANSDLQSAVYSYSRRIAREPLPWIYELRAEVYAKLNAYDKAVADMKVAVAETPTGNRSEKLKKYEQKLREGGKGQ